MTDRQFNVLFWVVVGCDVLLLFGIPQAVVRVFHGTFNEFDYVPMGMLNAYVLDLRRSRRKKNDDKAEPR